MMNLNVEYHFGSFKRSHFQAQGWIGITLSISQHNQSLRLKNTPFHPPATLRIHIVL